MAKHFSVTSAALKFTVYFLLLTLSLRCSNAARVLNEEEDEEDDDGADTSPILGEIDDEIPDAPAPVTSDPTVVGAATTNSAAVAAKLKNDHEHPPLTFFMHDILGSVADSKSNGVFPVSGEVPLLNSSNGVINDINMPSMTGLQNTNTNPNTISETNVKSNILNGGNGLQKLTVGSMTVINNELTQSHEVASSVVGKVQGFYLPISQDGSSQTVALTASLHGNAGEADRDLDTISFFGIHKTSGPVTQMAIVGGTGMYENAKGYGTIESIRRVDEHKTDGVETVLKLSVYLTS